MALNTITIMGRLTADPEMRSTQNGTPVASFTLAVDRDYKSQTGERETDFINCVAWQSTAENICKYYHKGSMAVVLGRLEMRKYETQDGQKRTATEIVENRVYFGESKPQNTQKAKEQVNNDINGFMPVEDDDLPF